MFACPADRNGTTNNCSFEQTKQKAHGKKYRCSDRNKSAVTEFWVSRLIIYYLFTSIVIILCSAYVDYPNNRERYTHSVDTVTVTHPHWKRQKNISFENESKSSISCIAHHSYTHKFATTGDPIWSRKDELIIVWCCSCAGIGHGNKFHFSMNFFLTFGENEFESNIEKRPMDKDYCYY